MSHTPGKWISYTPTWTATGGTPTIGDGTLTGKYCIIGNILHVKINMVIGSTTSLGTTTVWNFSLPATIVHDNAPCPTYILDSGTLEYTCLSRTSSSTTLRVQATTSAYAGYNQPMTWATGDVLAIAGTYEIA